MGAGVGCGVHASLKKRGSLKHLSKHPVLKELCGLPFWGIASEILEPYKDIWLAEKSFTGMKQP
jgi:hypothetical protein